MKQENYNHLILKEHLQLFNALTWKFIFLWQKKFWVDLENFLSWYRTILQIFPHEINNFPKSTQKFPRNKTMNFQVNPLESCRCSFETQWLKLSFIKKNVSPCFPDRNVSVNNLFLIIYRPFYAHKPFNVHFMAINSSSNTFPLGLMRYLVPGSL